MKKNRMMRLASILLVCVLLSTSVIGGTFAKYTTTVGSSDSARVAKWGFGTSAINIENLFATTYDDTVKSLNGEKVIAPGTAGFASFKFENSLDAGPEVAYTFKVSTAGSTIADEIVANGNITWALVTGNETPVYGTFAALLAKIEALDEDEEFAVGEIPTMVDKEYTVLWQWTFNNATDGNATATNDSYVGNLAVSENLIANLQISITAEQIN